MRKEISRAAALLLALSTLLVALPACGSGSSTSSKTRTQAEPAFHTLALVDATTGTLERFLPDTDGQGPTAVDSDRRGGWYVGGRFAHIGNVLRRGVVHLRSDGSIDPTFVPDLPKDMAISPIFFRAGVVYVGDFDGKGVFALDAKSGKRLWHTSTGDDPVYCFAYGNGVLYAGGTFVRIDGVARHGVAALDPTTGKPTPWRVRVLGDFRPLVASIVVANGLVYFGGDFTTVNGLKRELGVAAVSPRTGRPTAWAPKRTGAARSLGGIASILVTQGQVLAGSVDREGGFAAFDARSARALLWTKRLKGGAWALASSGNTAYLGGASENGFTRAGGKPANNLVSVVLPKGRFTDWRPDLGRCTTVDAVAVYRTKVLVAGWFSQEGCSS